MKQPLRVILLCCLALSVIALRISLPARRPQPETVSVSPQFFIDIRSLLGRDAVSRQSPSSSSQEKKKESTSPAPSSKTSSLSSSSSVSSSSVTPVFPSSQAAPAEEDSLTLFDCGTFQVAIPKEYIPSLKVTCVEGKISVWEKASLEQSEKDTGYPGGFLFCIAAISGEEVEDFITMDRPGSRIFAKDDERYYTYTSATDVQLYRSKGVTEADQELWDRLQQFSNGAAEDTRLRNGLSIYIDPSVISRPDIQLPDDLFRSEELTPCPTCHGELFCPQCNGLPSCTKCAGTGKDTCPSCFGRRKCSSCGGRGYTYKGVGLAFRQEKCSKCRGSGDCLTCQNTGRVTCDRCHGSPDCFFCRGTGMCPGCNGSGYLPW